MIPLEQKKQFEDLRARVLAGEEIPPEEYSIIVSVLREGREAAAEAAKKRPAKKKHNLTQDQVQNVFDDI